MRLLLAAVALAAQQAGALRRTKARRMVQAGLAYKDKMAALPTWLLDSIAHSEQDGDSTGHVARSLSQQADKAASRFSLSRQSGNASSSGSWDELGVLQATLKRVSSWGAPTFMVATIVCYTAGVGLIWCLLQMAFVRGNPEPPEPPVLIVPPMSPDVAEPESPETVPGEDFQASKMKKKSKTHLGVPLRRVPEDDQLTDSWLSDMSRGSQTMPSTCLTGSYGLESASNRGSVCVSSRSFNSPFGPSPPCSPEASRTMVATPQHTQGVAQQRREEYDEGSVERLRLEIAEVRQLREELQEAMMASTAESSEAHCRPAG